MLREEEEGVQPINPMYGIFKCLCKLAIPEIRFDIKF